MKLKKDQIPKHLKKKMDRAEAMLEMLSPETRRVLLAGMMARLRWEEWQTFLLMDKERNTWHRILRSHCSMCRLKRKPR